MYGINQINSNRTVPYWDEIKALGQEEKLKLIALLSASLFSETIGDDDKALFESQLSPQLMQKLAELSVKEHRAGRCISQDQVENSIMETMGWK